MTARPPARSPIPRIGYFLLGIGVVALLGALVADPFVEVPAGHRGVLFSLAQGVLSRQLGEGTHVVVPFVEKAVLYDVRTRTFTMSDESAEGEIRGDAGLSTLTKDGQEVKVDLSVRFHPDPENVFRLHQSVGQDYLNKVIRPEIRSQTRLAIAQYPVSDVYSVKRTEVEKLINDRLRASLSGHHVIVDEVLLRNIVFSKAYADAVELKQIAQQRAQRMEYVLQKAALEKQQKILEAQGDAASISLRGQAIRQNARVVQYEYARKIAPNVSTIVTDGKSGKIPFAAGAPAK